MADVDQLMAFHQHFRLLPVPHRCDAILLCCHNLHILTVRKTLSITPHPSDVAVYLILDYVYHLKSALFSLHHLARQGICLNLLGHLSHWHLNAKSVFDTRKQSHHCHKHRDERPLTILVLIFLHLYLSIL